MKKIVSTSIVLFCLLLSFSLNPVNNYQEREAVEQETQDEDPFYSFSGTITWYGEEGIALFYSPNGGGNFWVREAPYLLTVTTQNNVVIAQE